MATRIAGQTTLVADGTERGDRRLADESVAGRSGERDEPVEDGCAVRLVFAARPCRHFDDRRVVVVEGADEIDGGMMRGDLRGPSSNRPVGIAERACQHGVVEGGQAFQGAQRRRPHVRVVAVEAAAGGGGIAFVAGDGHLAPRRRPGHCLRRSVMVVTSQARPNAVTVAITTAMTIARPELATTAQIRRRMLGRL